ncbi:MAG: GumC family protein [Thiotrichales bacterium]
MNERLEQLRDFDDAPSLADYLEIIKRKIWLVIGLVVIGTAISAGFALKLPPVYESSGTILINEKRPSSDIAKGALVSDVPVQYTVEFLFRSIMTKNNLVKIAEKLNLYPEFRQGMPEVALAGLIQSHTKFSMLDSEVRNMMVGRVSKQQQVLEVSFDYENEPEVARDAAQAIMDLFLEKNAEDNQLVRDDARKFLLKEQAANQQKLDSLEKQLTEFKEKNFGLLPKQMELVVSERERTERELLNVEQQIRATRGSLIQYGGQLASINPYIYEDRTQIRNKEGDRVLSATGRLQTLQQDYHELISKYSPQHPKVKKLVREIESLGGNINEISASPLTNDNLELAEVELNEARQKYSSSHPLVKSLEAKVNRLKKEAVSGGVISERKDFNSLRRVNPAFSSLKAGIASNEAELQSLYERRDKLLEKIDEYTKKMSLGPTVEEELTRLDREYKTVLKQLSEINDELVVVDRQKAFRKNATFADTFVVLERPELPLGPVKPDRKAIIALGLLLSLAFSLILVILLDNLDESVNGQHTLKKITGRAPLGVISTIPK